jgi:hypothetical protein
MFFNYFGYNGLLNLDKNKSTGTDNIEPKILKVSAPFSVSPVTYMFNRIIDSGIYPNIFKNAKVSPIFKSILRYFITNKLYSLLKFLEVEIFSLLRFSIQEVKNMLKVFAISISRVYRQASVPFIKHQVLEIAKYTSLRFLLVNLYRKI